MSEQSQRDPQTGARPKCWAEGDVHLQVQASPRPKKQLGCGKSPADGGPVQRRLALRVWRRRFLLERPENLVTSLRRAGGHAPILTALQHQGRWKSRKIPWIRLTWVSAALTSAPRSISMLAAATLLLRAAHCRGKKPWACGRQHSQNSIVSFRALPRSYSWIVHAPVEGEAARTPSSGLFAADGSALRNPVSFSRSPKADACEIGESSHSDAMRSHPFTRCDSTGMHRRTPSRHCLSPCSPPPSRPRPRARAPQPRPAPRLASGALGF